jgi:hypothetical protein
MKYLLAVMCLLLLAFPCMAQQTVDVTYSWDAVTPPVPDPTNPVKYKFHLCTDSQLTQCSEIDTGTSTELSVPLASGAYWPFVTAYCYAVSAENPDGPYVGGPVMESEKSNVVPTRVIVPPGNPGNAKAKS